MKSYDVVLVLLYIIALVSSRERRGVGAVQRSSSPSVSLCGRTKKIIANNKTQKEISQFNNPMNCDTKVVFLVSNL